VAGYREGRSGFLPGGAPLAPGETPLVGDSFMLSTIAFFLHTELVLTNRRLTAVRPHTILGLIPVGTDRQSFPIENIAGVSSATRFDILGVIFGAVGALVGIAALAIPAAAWLGVILIVIGLASIIGAPKQAIEVMNSGGGKIRFPVSVLERSRTVLFANQMAEAVARTTGGGRYPAPVAGSAPDGGMAANPTEAMQHVRNLREQGLISDAEFAAKRSEILSRL
jgi:hypothetical protein